MCLTVGIVRIQFRQEQATCYIIGPGGTDSTVMCVSCLGTFLSSPTCGLMEDSLRLTKGQGSSADVAHTLASKVCPCWPKVTTSLTGVPDGQGEEKS